MGESAGSLKVRTPWALFGEELDGWGKLDATNRQFVHGLFKRNLGANQIQGVWHVAINDPDIDPDVLPILKNGSTWIAQTVDPVVPELADPSLPGIGNKRIYNGELIVWEEANLAYRNINISPLNANQADGLYVNLSGDTMTGELHLYGDPTVPLGAAPKQYIDDNFLPLTGGTLTGALTLPGIDLYDSSVGQNPWWGIYTGGGAGLLPDFALIRYDANGVPRGAPILINNTDPIIQGNAVINFNATVLLDRDPTQDMQAATKIYVDKGVSGAQQFIGSFDASTSIATFIPGALLPNGWLPPAAPEWANDYVIVNVRGTPAFGPPETRVLAEVGDWWICDGTTWFLLNVGSPSNLAANVAVNPPVFGESSVQDSLATAEATLVKKAGDSMTGSLNFLNIGNGLTFPGGMSFSSVAFDILGITAGTFLVSGAVTIGSTLNVTGLTSIANTLRVQSANNTGKLELHSGSTVTSGEISFYTPEGTRRGYMGYGSANIMHIKAENGYNWRFDDPINGQLTLQNGRLDLYQAGGMYYRHIDYTSANVGMYPVLQAVNSNGQGVAGFYAIHDGYTGYGGAQGQVYLLNGNGGYGWQWFMHSNVGPSTTFNGTVYATVSAPSDIRLKSNVMPVNLNEVDAAFKSFNPVRYKLKPPQQPDPLSATGYSNLPYKDPDRLHWGLVADDIEIGAPDLVTLADYTRHLDFDGNNIENLEPNMVKAYDVAGVLAIAIAKIKELEARLKKAGL
jgi:Chaperone of endosialidase